MGAWGWTVLFAVAAVLAALVWWTDRYPGGWRFAFHRQHADDRARLRTKRGNLRRLEHEAAGRLAALRAAVDAERSAYRSRIARAERRLEMLRAPGRGTLHSTMGPVQLHEHRLVVFTGGATHEYPLEEIAVRCERADGTGHLHLVLPDGRQQALDFPEEEYDPTELTQFAARTHDAIAAAKRATPLRLADIPRAEVELAEAVADTTGHEQALERLEQGKAEEAADTKIPAARRALDEELDRWHKITGTRPH
ncbi:hypothetical protein [Streptomyces sp. TLI_171]|uniref:hypothetical protein n=1 Tax=Streptomyces sp. TLI_171 TaxID=1938859 RepID=UPI000C173DCA|nr:hypothetical protein [Streptomyces sp. TLI_171]RKE16817.1 hypothetical protein BX266_0055 [Streptomyces sp. TLI_171]